MNGGVQMATYQQRFEKLRTDPETLGSTLCNFVDDISCGLGGLDGYADTEEILDFIEKMVQLKNGNELLGFLLGEEHGFAWLDRELDSAEQTLLEDLDDDS